MIAAEVIAKPQLTEAELTKQNLDEVFLRFEHVDKLNAELEASYRSGVLRGKPRHLVIFGDSGAGKTRLLEKFAARYPRVELPDRTLIPVLFVTMPSNPTPRKIVRSILTALGSPFANKGEDEDQLKHLQKLCEKCEVNLILMDEVSHLVDRGREKTHYKFGDALKEVVDSIKIPVVLSGIPRLRRLFEVNEQLRGRFGRRRHIKPFSLSQRDMAISFRRAVGTFQSKLLPLGTIDLTTKEVLPRVLFASNGLLRPIVEILKEAADLGFASSKREINLAKLEKAFRNVVWDEAPDERNPFSAKFNFLPLTGSGEPYAIPQRDR